jgi:hypothetical protein
MHRSLFKSPRDWLACGRAAGQIDKRDEEARRDPPDISFERLAVHSIWKIHIQ